MSATVSLAAVLAESARKYPHKVAVVDGEQRVTYETLWREARSCAAALRDQGVGPGDRVALKIPNVVDFPRVYFGALALGAVVVPVHLLLTAEEAAYTLKDSGARLLVCHPSQAAMGAAAAGMAGVGVVAPADLLGAVPLPTYVSRAAEDPAVVLYTSGTTGEPKGAVLTHLNLVMNA